MHSHLQSTVDASVAPVYDAATRSEQQAVLLMGASRQGGAHDGDHGGWPHHQGPRAAVRSGTLVALGH
eukprot:7512113-Lingulodinium_polyedra.AAC.1